MGIIQIFRQICPELLEGIIKQPALIMSILYESDDHPDCIDLSEEKIDWNNINNRLKDQKATIYLNNDKNILAFDITMSKEKTTYKKSRKIPSQELPTKSIKSISWRLFSKKSLRIIMKAFRNWFILGIIMALVFSFATHFYEVMKPQARIWIFILFFGIASGFAGAMLNRRKSKYESIGIYKKI